MGAVLTKEQMYATGWEDDYEVNIDEAGIVSIVIGIVGVVVHMLIMCQIVPFQWVNGGRSASLEIAHSAVFLYFARKRDDRRIK